MKYLICFLFFQTICISQENTIYSSVEKGIKNIPENQTKTSKDIADYIKKHFITEDQQIKAAYYYVISTISYDIKHQFTVNLIITEDDMVSKTIVSKKGVCIHYARFFKDIVSQLGFDCQIISGYTKKSNNNIADLSHAWCGIKMKDNKWYIFDPTWDSGYIQNGNFVRKINSKYYKIGAVQSIKTHMPFDYIWQFSNYPINEKQFVNNDGKNLNQEAFDFDNAIKKYLELTDHEQLRELKIRMNETGHTSKLAQERFDILVKQIAVFEMNESIKKYNQISERYNEGVRLLNEFISYRNAQFRPEKQDHIIKQMINEPLVIFQNCNEEIYNIGFVGQENLYGLNKFKRGLIDVIEETKKHNDFVELYIKSNKSQRKKMFMAKKEKMTF